MILAAGVGSRLRPLTNNTPKALLPFQGKTMLEHVLDQLKSHGINEVIINLHHLGEQIERFVGRHHSFGMKIAFSDECDELLDTGGGMMRAWWFLDEAPFIVHNVDIKTNLDYNGLYRFHLEKGALATLAVKNRSTSRNLLTDEHGLLCGWRNNQTGEEIIVRRKQGLKPVAFSGIHVADPKLFHLVKTRKPFSIIKKYLELAGQFDIRTFDHSDDSWTDMAHRDNFKDATS